MGQQLRTRVKQQRRKRWIERKKKAAHLAAKNKAKPAPAPVTAVGGKGAPVAPATASVPAQG